MVAQLEEVRVIIPIQGQQFRNVGHICFYNLKGVIVRSDGKDLKKFEKSAAKLVESNAMRTFEEFFLSHRITVSK
jgi:hypothetical protein